MSYPIRISRCSMLCWEAGLTEQHWAAPTSCFLTNKWKVLICREIFLIFMGASRAASWFSTTIERFGLFTTHELSSVALVKHFLNRYNYNIISAKEILFHARSFFMCLGVFCGSKTFNFLLNLYFDKSFCFSLLLAFSDVKSAGDCEL